MTTPALTPASFAERPTARDHYAARWPHLDEFLTDMRRLGHPTNWMCRALGASEVTFSLQKQSGRVSFAMLRALVQKFGAESTAERWDQRLRDSVVVEHTKKGFTVPPDVDRLARTFDAEHRSWMYVMDGGGYFEPIAESYKPLALAPHDTAAAGGNAAPPAPDNADSQSASHSGEVSASSPTLIASPLPVGEPLGEVDAMVMIAAKLIRERDYYAGQLAIQRTRLEQATAAVQRELDAARQTIAAQQQEIAKLKADIVEWQQLAEREPERTDERPVSEATARALTAAVAIRQDLNGERLGLFEELNQLPKFPGHGG